VATSKAAAQAKRREKIARVLDNSSTRSSAELIRLVDDPVQRAALGLVGGPIEFIELVIQHVTATVNRLEAISRQLWNPQIPDALNVRIIINYRESAAGRSNASSRSSAWRSQSLTRLLPEGPCINLNAIWRAMNRGMFHEYRFIHLDPHIGSIATTDWKEYIELLMAHEYAHILDLIAVQCSAGTFPIYLSKRVVGHDQNWQSLYRKLRIATGYVRTEETSTMAIDQAISDVARKCIQCQGPIRAIRCDAKFCCTKCRVYHSRKQF
jgi:hypothetical protein